jgi:UDP-N-acetyl-D-glucosamine/UDP-N-acetyl-D-galactosamine dehydrogenase
MTHNRKISVVGLGYVGLPVAVEFGKRQRVIGFDINPQRIQELKRGWDRTREVGPHDLRDADILYTDQSQDLRAADFHIVAVPTPVDRAKQPDLGAVLRASETVGRQLKTGDIVVYESTVYPGATEEDCVPVLEHSSGLRCGLDFFVGYSPERINPGDKAHVFKNITKIVSGQTPEVLDIVAAAYGSVVTAGVHRASSIKVAEAAKVIENTQRDLNISLMNELAVIFHKMGIDTHDVLAAAGTKWNFLPFDPGLVGGHCIGVDPYYLTYKAQVLGYIPQVILAGRSINDGLGAYIASQVVKQLIHAERNVKGSAVTVLGITFKEDVPDLRNSRVIDIVENLWDYGVQVQVHDPFADPSEAEEEYGLSLLEASDLAPADAVVLAVRHKQYVASGWDGIIPLLKGGAGVVIDVKAALPRRLQPPGVRLWRL